MELPTETSLSLDMEAAYRVFMHQVDKMSPEQMRQTIGDVYILYLTNKAFAMQLMRNGLGIEQAPLGGLG